MTFEESKIREKALDHVANVDVSNATVHIMNKMCYEMNESVSRCVTSEIIKAYEKGYNDALKEMEEQNGK